MVPSRNEIAPLCFCFFRGLPFFVLFLLVFFPRGLGFFDPFTSKNIGGFVCVLA